MRGGQVFFSGLRTGGRASTAGSAGLRTSPCSVSFNGRFGSTSFKCPTSSLNLALKSRWRALMTKHVGSIDDLRHTFGPPNDFALTDGVVHFTLPTHWKGVRDGKPFAELGGWTFVQVREDGGWRILSYGWAVISFEEAQAPGPPEP